MGMKAKGFVCAVVAMIFLFFVASLAGAQVVASSKMTPALGANDIGLVFSSSNILFGLESYQAGIGAKIAWGNIALRGGLDVGLNGTSQAFSLNLNLAVENHFISGAISPYFGAYALAGYNTQPEVLTAIPFSVGAIAGVEVFIFDFLSVFAEYALAADFIMSTDLATSVDTFDYAISAKMGNNSMIGVVVYFQRDKSRK